MREDLLARQTPRRWKLGGVRLRASRPLFLLLGELLERPMEVAIYRAEGFIHPQGKTLNRHTREDKRFYGEDDIAIIIEVNLTHLLLQVCLNASLQQERLIVALVVLPFEERSYHEELWIVLSVEEATNKPIHLIHNTCLLTTLGAVALTGERLQDSR